MRLVLLPKTVAFDIRGFWRVVGRRMLAWQVFAGLAPTGLHGAETLRRMWADPGRVR